MVEGSHFAAPLRLTPTLAASHVCVCRLTGFWTTSGMRNEAQEKIIMLSGHVVLQRIGALRAWLISSYDRQMQRSLEKGSMHGYYSISREIYVLKNLQS